MGTKISNNVNAVTLAGPNVSKNGEPAGGSYDLAREALLEIVLETSLAGYWDWNIAAGSEYLSPRFKSMFGYADDEMENSPEAWQRIIFQEDLQTLFKEFEEHVATRGRHPFSLEARYHHRDESTVWVYCRGRVIEWDPDSGAPLRMVGCHIDITKQKSTEAELRRSNADLADFASVLAHDLQSPLMSVIGGLDLLQHGWGDALPTEAQEVVENAIAATERISTFTSGLLNYSQARDGLPDDDRKRVIVSEILTDVLANFAAEIESSSAQVEVSELPDVFGNRTQILQVFQNLIGNALKYRGSDEPRIRISASPTTAGWHEFAVRDNGQGIKPEDTQQVFEMLVRCEHKASVEGAGIGLAVVKRVITSHGGEITVDSAPSAGTTFRFTLPTT